jgi:hypothetical protein
LCIAGNDLGGTFPQNPDLVLRCLCADHEWIWRSWPAVGQFSDPQVRTLDQGLAGGGINSSILHFPKKFRTEAR